MSGRFLIGAMVLGLIAVCYAVDYAVNHKKHMSGTQIISRNATLLMIYIGISVTLGLYMAGRSSYIATRVVSIAISVFVFEVILLLASDLLRKVCSPAVMVGLWGIVNVLYFLLLASGYSSNLEPLRVIPVPRTVFLPALALWAAGFAFLMGRSVLEHLSFVRQVREGSRIADAEHDAQLMEVYKKVLNDYEMAEVPVRLSPAVSVPVAVGLMRIEIVLPVSREYGKKTGAHGALYATAAPSPSTERIPMCSCASTKQMQPSITIRKIRCCLATWNTRSHLGTTCGIFSRTSTLLI